MRTVTYKRTTFFWNGFAGFFFVPVGPGRKRERIIKEGTALYSTLRNLPDTLELGLTFAAIMVCLSN